FAQTHPSRHRHADFTNHLSGVTRHDGSAENFIAPLADVEFHETLFLTVQYSAVHLLELAHIGIDFQAAFAGVTLVEANVGNFRVGVSAPGHREGAGFLAAKEQGILNYDPGRKIGGMGEFSGQANITGRVDARVGGLETIVYQHAFARIVLDAHGLQIDPFDIRRAAGTGKDLIHNDRLLLSLRLKADTFLDAIPLDASNPGVEPHCHARPDE